METARLFTVDEVNRILNARFVHGKSLKIVANEFGTTRILIRQLESNYIKRLKGEIND